jgi:hypothetical protein
MTISRTIGYHEKKEKHRTAPARKNQEEACRRARAGKWDTERGRVVADGGLEVLAVATMPTASSREVGGSARRH